MLYVTKPELFSVRRSYAGLGLFAKVPFRKGDFVIEYTGEMVSSKEADDRNSLYLFDVNARWVIDAAGRENLARYINHSCEPNCKPEVRGKRILIFAKRLIRPGEELTYNYGKEYFNEYIKPKGCRCQACVQRGRKN